MLKQQKTQPPVKVVLKTHMIVDGEPHEKGDVVEVPYREFVYLSNYNRVAEANKENIAAVKAEIKAEEEAAEKQAAQASELETTKALLAAARAQIAELEKKAK